jgi:hypothetical protein
MGFYLIINLLDKPMANNIKFRGNTVMLLLSKKEAIIIDN